MPQPRTPSKDEPSLREQLSKVLDPLGLVVLTRERVAEALDDAVQRGRMTRDDATELATALISRGRQSTEDVIADLEQLLGRQTADAGRAGDANGFPIPDYEELTAAQVTARLGDLAPDQLRAVRDHEKRHANRKSVLQAVDRKLA